MNKKEIIIRLLENADEKQIELIFTIICLLLGL